MMNLQILRGKGVNSFTLAESRKECNSTSILEKLKTPPSFGYNLIILNTFLRKLIVCFHFF